ncbi:MAG: hypothetical protein HY426_04005 [Candidatus Levybacteria bacterium]|nr:hypothetical protein [Candidatus Levybacteria bacterium]
MQPNVKIRRLLFVFFFIFIIVCLVLIGYFIYQRSRPTNTFVNNVEKKVLAVSGYKELPANIEDKLSIINNTKKTKDERYKALYDLSFIFANAYSTTHDPSIRKFSSEVIDSYFKSQFPDEYNDSLFNFPCADPECGQKLSPEIESVIKEVSGNDIPSYMKNTIIINLTSAGYVPDSDIDGKRFGINLVVDQLKETGDAQASKSAEKLVNYFKDRYKADL